MLEKSAAMTDEPPTPSCTKGSKAMVDRPASPTLRAITAKTAVIAICVPALAPLALVNGLGACKEFSVRSGGSANLREIVSAWMIHDYNHPGSPFDDAEARASLPPLYSPWSQAKAYRRSHDWTSRVGRLLNRFLVFQTGLLALTIYAWTRRRRWGQFVTVALILALPVTGALLARHSIADAIWPKSYDYLEDYVLVPSPPASEWAALDQVRVIAYSKAPITGVYHVAFSDAHIDTQSEDELRVLLRTQSTPWKLDPSRKD